MIGLFVLSVVVVFIGNTQQLLSYYGLSSSDDVLKQGTSHAITSGLSKLDGFSVTAKVVTFIVWAVIGILCFSVVQVLARLYHEFEEEEKVSSNHYIHPKTFVRAAFWGRVISDFFFTVLGLSMLLTGLYLLVAYILPITMTYSRSYLLGASLIHLGSLLIGFFMLLGWILLLATILKLIVNRHRLSKT